MARLDLDPFEALGLPRDASASTIKAQYHALARRYHPNRHQGPDDQKQTLADRFHAINTAWNLLSKADNRRRQVELLNLLELQDDLLAHFGDLLSTTAEEEHGSKHHGHADSAEVDGHVSSDADEDIPGLVRRQTVLANSSTGDRYPGDRRGSLDTSSPTSPSSKRQNKWRMLQMSGIMSAGTHGQDSGKDSDYFAKRRKKLEKLQRKEFEAFMDYRNAMIAKFDAEEEAEKQHERYERAKWKREYLERAPRGTTERMRSFQHFMGAVCLASSTRG